MDFTAKVAVDNATFNFDNLYSYACAAEHVLLIKPGVFVLVPFGRTNALRMGLVVEVEQDGESEKGLTGADNARGVQTEQTFQGKQGAQAEHTSQIMQDMQSEQPLQPEQASQPQQALQQQKGEKRAALKTIVDCNADFALSPELMELVFFLKQRTFCTYYEAARAVTAHSVKFKIAHEHSGYKIKKLVSDKTVAMYALNNSGQADENAKLTPKQAAVKLFLQAAGKAAAQDITAQCGVGKSVIDGLVKKDVLTVANEVVFAQATAQKTAPDTQKIKLNAAQQHVFNGIATLLNTGKAEQALLHGITSSGKTVVFIKLIESALKAGRSCVLLVPEISLTPQMVAELSKIFGQRIVVQHSKLTPLQRFEQWKKLESGAADIVVGTRSAIFAPLDNIGLIIVDEEQESTYCSESDPRYNAKDVALYRALKHKALLLLASATPSVETYHKAKSGRINLFEIGERYNAQPLPQVEIIDMRKELSDGNAGHISVRMADEIHANLKKGEQSILLINRRGYQTVARCTTCGTVVNCDNCSVPMVYHKKEGALVCHYCAAKKAPAPEICPICGGKLRYKGYGTERVEEEIQRIFPSARLLRMDFDTANKNQGALLAAFARGEYDILVGTQMVAKGLNFKKVTLVGVLGIDQTMATQGFRAFEKAFSLITQVVGRGGRGESAGTAFIETMDPQNLVINLAAKQDYAAFYENEINYRKINLYPPFCSICVLGFTGTKESEVIKASQAFVDILSALSKTAADVPLRVLGPAPFNVAIVNNKVRYKLTVKCKNDARFRQLMGLALMQYNKQGLTSKADIYIDFNSDADY